MFTKGRHCEKVVIKLLSKCFMGFVGIEVDSFCGFGASVFKRMNYRMNVFKYSTKCFVATQHNILIKTGPKG